MQAWTDKDWESREISLWVNNDERLWELARTSRNPKRFLERLEDAGIFKIGGITLTLENVRESWEDTQDDPDNENEFGQ